MEEFHLKFEKLNGNLQLEIQVYPIVSNAAEASAVKLIKNEHFSDEHIQCLEQCSLISEVQTLVAINNLSVLILSNCGLTNVPDCFKILRIKRLDLDHNKLSEVPNCLVMGLCRIEELNLSFNCLNHFDIELKCLKCLRMINLERNKIAICPLWLFSLKCPQLETFVYNYNLMPSKYVTTMGICSKLKIMKVGNSRLTQKHLGFLKLFPLLTDLSLSNNLEFDTKSRNCFDNCDQLFYNPLWKLSIHTLNIQNLDISSLPEELCDLVNLKELNVSHNNLVWLPDSMGNMKNLETLHLNENMITHLPTDLNQMVNLRKLFAAQNTINVVPKVGKNLIVLDLYSNCIDSVSFSELKDIEFMDLDQNYLQIEEEDFLNYNKKKLNFRSSIYFSTRIDGMKTESLDDDNEATSGSSSPSDSLYQYALTGTDLNVEVEIWEVNASSFARDDDVTLSDNEWLGNFESKKKLRPPRKVSYYDQELYYFCDAD